MRNPLKLRKNKSFEYTPRYYKGQGNPYKIEPKLEQFRTTVYNQRGLKNKLSNAFDDIKREGDRNLRVRFIIIFSILILVFLYIIDFDLSIFLNP